MQQNHIKLYLLITAIAGIMCCVFGWIYSLNEYQKNHPYEQAPIRTLSIQIKEDQREELFSQLQRFSEKHHLEFYLSFYRGKEIFFIVMYGDKFHISTLSKPINTTDLDINFFAEDPTNPSLQEVANELFSDLKNFINNIPNVVILQEK
ncbi:MAG: hypothetical protein AB1607_16100 [Chloroflexota bacterium]